MNGWMRTVAVGTLVGLLLTGCTPPGSEPGPTAPAVPQSPGPGTSGPPSTATNAPGTSQTGPVQPVGSPTVIARDLDAPWSILRLHDSRAQSNGADVTSTLISERDSGVIKELTADGSVRTAGKVPGVVHAGEGGLLGIEAWYQTDATWIYAYLTTASDNRIVRMRLTGTPGNHSLGAAENILTGLAKAGNHDGGRIKFGPDGMLYATVGDAGQPARAQDVKSLNGKILRMRPDGSVPADNPFPGSLVYSLGHRNPQGLAWDASGQLWAAEFGQNTWDELNIISPSKNYGWPLVEGIGNQNGYVDPVQQWSTSEASPSGLAFVDGTFFLAALRGQRLWTIVPADQTRGIRSAAWFEGTYGRLRDVSAGPNGTLWVLTNNTDGRGSARAGDDKLLQVQLGPAR